MKSIRKLVAIAASISLVACATSPRNVSPQYISPMMYSHLTCDQIRAEMMRVGARVETVTGQQQRAASNDAVAMGVGLVLFWPALFFLANDNDKREELSRLMGEHEALQQAGNLNNCFVAPSTPAASLPTPAVAPTAAFETTTPAAAPTPPVVPGPIPSPSPAPAASVVGPTQDMQTGQAAYSYNCSNGQVLRIVFDYDRRRATVVRFGQPDVRLERAAAQSGFRYVRGSSRELTGNYSELLWRVGTGEPVRCSRI